MSSENKKTSKSPSPARTALSQSRRENVETVEEWSQSPIKLLKHKKWIKRATVLFLLVFVAWFVPFVPKLSTSSITVTRWTKAQGKVRAKVGPRVADWAPIGEVSKHVWNALVVAEDDLFFEHHGLDWMQIRQSIQANMKSKKYKRGASTITQQVVKMAFLTRDKTLTRKTREALGAVLLETFYRKERILEWYVNLIEFGDNVYGIKTAARHYFQTKPSNLTISQAIHLALVVPSPNAWSRGLRQRSLTPFGHARFYKIATAMRRRGFITEDQWNNALASGDFGRPIAGYAPLMQDEEPTGDEALDPGDHDDYVAPPPPVSPTWAPPVTATPTLPPLDQPAQSPLDAPAGDDDP